MRASIDTIDNIVRISYGNSVLVSVTTQYRSEPRCDRDFWFLPYDSLESLVFCYKISCHWVKGVPTNEGEKEGHPLKKCYSIVIGLYNVKMVADRPVSYTHLTLPTKRIV